MTPVEPILLPAPVVRRHRRERSTFTVLVCRGCCCGTARKHPHINHSIHLGLIHDATRVGGGELRVVDCLDVCTHSNVVVVRRRGQRASWLGNLNTDTGVDLLGRWLRSGAHHQPPQALTRIHRDIHSEAIT